MSDARKGRLARLGILFAVVSVALCRAVLPAARAEAPPGVKDRRHETERARRLFNEAETRFAQGEYRQALALYQQAFELKPLPGFQLNIGQCYRRLGQCDKAIEHYRRYLDQSRNPKHQADAQGLIDHCERQLAEERRNVPGPPAAGAKQAEAPPAPVTAPVSGPPAPRRRLRPHFFWTGVGVSAALLLTGTITGSLALGKSSRFNDPNTPSGELGDLKSSGESLRTASTVTFALGLVATAGTAALLFFTDFRPKERAASVSASPIPGGGLMLMGGQF